MNCPVCGELKTRVVRTFPIESDEELHLTDTYRTRICRKCRHQFTTIEISQPTKQFTVGKRSNKTDTFSYKKLFTSIQKACEDLSIPYDDQRSIFVNVMKDIIIEVQKKEDKTRIMSQDIGTFVVKHLKSVNRIAWIRYSAYFYKNEEIVLKNLREWIAQESDSVE